MNRLNRIFHNKQIKLFWFLRSFARYLTPKRLLQSRLDRVLAEAERRPDWEYIFGGRIITTNCRLRLRPPPAKGCVR